MKRERQVCEIFKRNKIKFKAKARMGKFEIDFLAGKVAIEIDGKTHIFTNREKDIYLFSKGYIPFHIKASKIKNNPKLEKEMLYLIRVNNNKN